MSGDVEVRGSGLKSYVFSQKNSTNLVPTTLYEAMFDAI